MFRDEDEAQTEPSPRRGEGRERGLGGQSEASSAAPPHLNPLPSGERKPSWQSYVVPQGWDKFTAENHAVWDLLFARQVELLGSRVVSPFLDGIDLLRLSHPGIPELAELNAILQPRTGWRTVAVPGLVPDDIFFAMLAERVFPVGDFIRLREQLDYLEAPDCFHDLFGHIPMLAHHDFAEMVEHIGRLGQAAIAAGEGQRMARIYWHSVEFGLAIEGEELKILGAGLASSFGESHFSLESETVERSAFSVERALGTPYRHDTFQPLYLVSSSLESTIRSILALTPGRLLEL